MRLDTARRLATRGVALSALTLLAGLPAACAAGSGAGDAAAQPDRSPPRAGRAEPDRVIEREELERTGRSTTNEALESADPRIRVEGR